MIAEQGDLVKMRIKIKGIEVGRVCGGRRMVEINGGVFEDREERCVELLCMGISHGDFRQR
jgi:hypothetical protein